jgi:hypothetical protein
MLQQVVMVGDDMRAERLLQLPHALLELLCLCLGTGSRSCQHVARELGCVELLLQKGLQRGLRQHLGGCGMLLLVLCAMLLLPSWQLLLVLLL